MKVSDKPVAIVTGAGSGIGRAVAQLLAHQGFDLGLVGRRAGAIEETAEDLHEGCESFCLPIDVGDPISGHEMVQAALERFGRLDVLVNNAGSAPLLPIHETTPEIIQSTFMTNAVGPACAIAAAWPVFQRQHEYKRASRFGSCIVNISTMGTEDPFPGFFAYAASKAGVNLMAKSCAKEGKAIGVRAFAIAPGAVETEMLRSIFSTTAVPAEKCLQPMQVAEEVMACIMGEREGQNGKTIFLRAS